MAKLNDFSKIYNGGKSIAKVYWGALPDLEPIARDISTNNQAIKVTASTTLTGTNVSMLFDGIIGNNSNRWVSTENDAQPKLTITLDEPYGISQIIIHNGLEGSYFVENVEIIIDGINQGTFIGNKTPIDINFVNNPIGKVIELKFPAGYNRIYEIEIYGKRSLNIIWQKKPEVYLARDSDFVKVSGYWVYRGAELEVEMPTHINGELVTSTQHMFRGGSPYNASPVNKVILKQSNVTNMDNMFSYTNVTRLDLSNFNTSNVTSMRGMFQHTELTTLDLSSFNVSNVTDMAYMFNQSSATIGYARTQADVDKFNASPNKPTGLNFRVKASSTLIAGNMQAGFYGEVPASEFITGNALASLVGLTTGTSINPLTSWLKFSFQGKTLFFPKKVLRHTVTVQQLASLDLISGSKTVTVGNNNYKVRLIKGANSNPATGTRVGHLSNSEWDKLMLPLSNKAPYRFDSAYTSMPTANFGTKFTEVELGTQNMYTYCQEAYTGGHYIARGNSSIENAGGLSKEYASSDRGWRPILELIVP